MVDSAREQGFDWSQQRVSIIIGEEPFGEHYRSYLARQLAIDLDSTTRGWIGSSYGVAELGLNILFETRQSARLRRLAHSNQSFRDALFGPDSRNGSVATLFHYNPMRTYIEILNPDEHGFGQLVVSMIEHRRVIPLIRYMTGDIARMITCDSIRQAYDQLSVAMPTMSPLPIVALLGREKSNLPAGGNVIQFQDALYANYAVADAVTGAFRLVSEDGETTMHIQLRKNHREPVARLVSDGLLAEFKNRTSFSFGPT